MAVSFSKRLPKYEGEDSGIQPPKRLRKEGKFKLTLVPLSFWIKGFKVNIYVI
jgi:hypothetical protein